MLMHFMCIIEHKFHQNIQNKEWKTWHITNKNKTNEQILKMTKITYMQTWHHTYMKKILWSILCILLISGEKWSHLNEEENPIGVTQNRVGNCGETKEPKKYGCVCTCCHADDLLRNQCVIFLRNNYNFDIPAVSNALSKRYREIRQKEFICKPCHKQLKDGTYSNNVQNCGNSDLFGSNFTHEQNDQDIVYRSRTDKWK